MKKKQKNNIIGGLIIAIVLFLFVGVGSYMLQGGGLSVVSDIKPDVSKALFSQTYCAPCFTGTTKEDYSIDVGGFLSFGTERKTWEYKCGSNEDIRNGCEIILTRTTGGDSGDEALYICNKNADRTKVYEELDNELDLFNSGREIGNCNFYPKIGDGDDFTVADGDTLFLITDGDIDIDIEYQPFCLFTETGDNRLSSFSSCNVEELINKNDAEFFGYWLTGTSNNIQNVVYGYTTLSRVSDIVKYNNEWLYLKSSGSDIVACEIEKGTDGTYYVNDFDCSKKSNLICLPSSPTTGFSCIDGVKLVDIKVGSECSSSGEFLIGEELCDIVCENGVITKQTNCREVENVGTPYEGIPVTPDKSDFNPILLIIIGSVIFLILIMIIIKKQMGGSGSSKLQL